MADDEPKPDKMAEHVKTVTNDSDELVAAFYEAIERLQIGNPRFTKKERVMWGKFFTNAIADIGVLVWMMQSHNTLRLREKELHRMAKYSYKLGEKGKGQLITIMRIVREKILDGDTKEAIEVLTKIISYYENEPPMEFDC